MHNHFYSRVLCLITSLELAITSWASTHPILFRLKESGNISLTVSDTPAGYITSPLQIIKGLLCCLILCVALQMTSANGFSIQYTLDEPAFVSLGIYDRQGTQLRTLLRGEEQQAGVHTLLWDGRNRFGESAPPGEYTWRALAYPGIKAEYLMAVGTNTDWPAWQLWVGNHMGPRALAVDPDNDWAYVVAGNSEGPPVIRQFSRNGTRSGWTKEHGEFWASATGGLVVSFDHATVTDGMLYVMAYGGNIYRVDTATAAHTRSALTNVLYPGDVARSSHKDTTTQENISRMHLEADRDYLVVSYFERNAVRLFSRHDGKLVREWPVERPAAMAKIADGKVLVVGDGAVRELTLASGEVRPLFTDLSLGDPIAVDYDAHNGHLLAAVNHQVRRYDLATGTLIQVYGREGGRKLGRFDNGDFSDIYDLAADGEGGFYTAEELPRRVARFTDDSRTPKREWFGGVHWGSMVTVDPQRPHIGYSVPDAVHFMRFEIDWEKRTWYPTHLYRPNLPRSSKNDGALWARTGRWDIREYHGRRWLVWPGAVYSLYAPSFIEIDDSGELFRPASAMGTLLWHQFGGQRPNWWEEASARYTASTGKQITSQHGNTFTWVDRNSDGAMQSEEIVPRPMQPFGGGHMGHPYIADDLTLFFAGGAATALLPEKRNIHGHAAMWYRITPMTDTDGIPAWDWGNAEPVFAEVPEEILDWGRGEPSGIWVDAQGAVYQIWMSSRPTSRGQDRHASGWPHNEIGAARIFKWHPDGTLAWSVGKHAVYKGDEQAGELSKPLAFLGMVEDRILLHDRAGRICSAWTTDGLVAGQMFDRHADDGLPVDWLYRIQALVYPKRYLFADDHISSNLIHLHDGRTLWMTPAQDSTPIYQLHDIAAGRQLSGVITMTQPVPAAQANGTGLHGRYYRGDAIEGIPVFERRDEQIWFGERYLQVYQLVSTPFFTPDAPLADQQHFAILWEGKIEARFAEAYRFVVETHGRLEHGHCASVRLFIDGQPVIDTAGEEFKPPLPQHRTTFLLGTPIELQPEKPVTIRLEYLNRGSTRPHLHLMWESASQEREHIPATALYPPEAREMPVAP